MAQVSNVVLKYAARGADAAARKDKKVRKSVKRTGKEARKQSSTVRRWMQRHRAAIAGIGAATGAALAAIIKKSPTMRGELAGMRLGFSLFAMTIGEDVAPALGGLSDKILDAQEAYADLDPAVRKPISALITFGFVTFTAIGAIALLETVLAGTTIASVLSSIGGAAWAYAGGISAATAATVGWIALLAALVLGIALVSSELIGLTDVTRIVERDTNSFLGALADLAFFLVGPWLGLVMAAVALFTDGWDEAKRIVVRTFEEVFKSFMRFSVRLGAGLLALRETIKWAFSTAWESVKNESKKFFNWILSKAESVTNRIISKLNKLPELDFDKVSFGSFETQSRAEIGRSAGQDLARRMANLQQRRDAMLDRFAADEIKLPKSLRKQSQPRRQPALGLRRPQGADELARRDRTADAAPQPAVPSVEDYSTQIEQLEITVPPTTGDPNADGREAGRAAMEYIEEQREKR